MTEWRNDNFNMKLNGRSFRLYQPANPNGIPIGNQSIRAQMRFN